MANKPRPAGNNVASGLEAILILEGDIRKTATQSLTYAKNKGLDVLTADLATILRLCTELRYHAKNAKRGEFEEL